MKVGTADECWMWIGTKHHAGYGVIWVNDNLRAGFAHRVSYELLCGHIPEGMLVCHKCDTPLCVNPNHLFLGTEADNTWDSVRKMRSRVGILNGRAKLTREQVDEMRNRYDQGEYANDLAREFGMGKSQTLRIVNRKNWK